MADDFFTHLNDIFAVLGKTTALKQHTDIDVLGSKGGFPGLGAELKEGAHHAQIEMFDGSADTAEANGRAANAAARARRHDHFTRVIRPAILLMAKNSAKNKAIGSAFALAGLHLLPIKEFNLLEVVEFILFAVGTRFGIEVTRDFKERKEKQPHALPKEDVAALIEEMRKLDMKATIKLDLLASLNFYDSPSLTQAGVLAALSVLSTVGLYGLLLSVKYAEMKGEDWKTWESDSFYGQYWQRTRIPEMAGQTLIKTTQGVQASLPNLGRVAKAVASGRLVGKGMGIIVPFEPALDMLVEHTGLVQEIAVKGGAFATVGILTGLSFDFLLTNMKKYGRRTLTRVGISSSPKPPSVEATPPVANLKQMSPQAG